MAWLCKLLLMPSDRLPRICYNRLCFLSGGESSIYCNWAVRLGSFFRMVDGESLWERQDLVRFRENLGLLVERLNDHFRALDDNWIAGSRYCPLYVSMTVSAGFLLSCRSVTGRMRVIRQLRTANVRVISIYVAGNSYKVDPGEQCTICNLRESYNILISSIIFFWSAQFITLYEMNI